jgi:hypothetical protein
VRHYKLAAEVANGGAKVGKQAPVVPLAGAAATPDADTATDASSDTGAKTLPLPSAPVVTTPASATTDGDYASGTGTNAGAAADYGGGARGGVGANGGGGD